MKGEHSKAGIQGRTTTARPRTKAVISRQGTRRPANNNYAAPGTTHGQAAKKRYRGADGRLFAQMSVSQLRAAEQISLGFTLRTAGLGFRTQSFTRQPTATGNSGARHLELMQGFTGWAMRLPECGLSLSAALDILVFGKSCRAVDKARRKRNGFARTNLMESLALFEREFL